MLPLFQQFQKVLFLEVDKKFEKISEYNYQVETTTLRYEDDEQTRKLLEVERQFNKISQEEYDRAKLELDFEGDELKLEQLHHQFKNNKISEKHPIIMCEKDIRVGMPLRQVRVNTTAKR